MEGQRSSNQQRVHQLLTQAGHAFIARAQVVQQGPQQAPPFVQHQNISTDEYFVGIVPFLQRVLLICASGFLLLVSSMILYGLFYFAVMPGHMITEPLFFDYSGTTRHPAALVCTEESLNGGDKMLRLRNDNRHVQEEKPVPWAAVDLFAAHSPWEAFQDEVVPKPASLQRKLYAGKSYYLEVKLELPDSEINRRAGMFGVLVEVQSPNGTKLASSMRAARFPHESVWVNTVRKFVMLLPLIIGALQESRIVIIPSFRNFVESMNYPLVG